MPWGKTTPQLMQEKMEQQAREHFDELTNEQIEEIKIAQQAEQDKYLKEGILEAIEVGKRAFEKLLPVIDSNIEEAHSKNEISKENLDIGSQYRIQAEITALLSGLRSGVVISPTASFDARTVPGLEELLKKYNPNLVVGSKFIYDVKKIQERLDQSSDLIDQSNLDPDKDLVDQIELLSHTTLENKPTSEQDLAIGLILGFPESVINDFLKEKKMDLSERRIPLPAQFHSAWRSGGASSKMLNDINMTDEDSQVLNALGYEAKKLDDHLLKLSISEQLRMIPEYSDELNKTFKSHLEEWYQRYYGLSKKEAEFIASRRTINLFIGDLPGPAMTFIAHGEPEKDLKQLIESFETVNKLL